VRRGAGATSWTAGADRHIPASMSVYAKAWIYVLIAAALIALYLTFERAISADYRLPILIGVFALNAGLAFILFKCPACGTSVFAACPSIFGPFVPWPHRICRKCGQDNRTGKHPSGGELD